MPRHGDGADRGQLSALLGVLMRFALRVGQVDQKLADNFRGDDTACHKWSNFDAGSAKVTLGKLRRTGGQTAQRKGGEPARLADWHLATIIIQLAGFATPRTKFRFAASILSIDSS